MSLISLWSPASHDLKSLRWKKRVLLVFAANFSAPEVKEQSELLEKQKAGCEERDLAVFIVAENGSAIRSKLRVPSDQFTVVLIGKDGTEKLRQGSVIAPEKLFEVIDSMPMRRAGER